MRNACHDRKQSGSVSLMSVQQMKFHPLWEHCCHGNLSLYERHESAIALRTLQAKLAISSVCQAGLGIPRRMLLYLNARWSSSRAQSRAM